MHITSKDTSLYETDTPLISPFKIVLVRGGSDWRASFFPCQFSPCTSSFLSLYLCLPVTFLSIFYFYIFSVSIFLFSVPILRIYDLCLFCLCIFVCVEPRLCIFYLCIFLSLYLSFFILLCLPCTSSIFIFLFDSPCITIIMPRKGRIH